MVVVDGATNTNMIQIYRSILQKEGILGLWAGNGANLLRVFPAKAVVFSSNDVYKQLLRNFCYIAPNDPLPGYLAFAAGGMSGMSASLLTYPLDFCRGRISGKLATTTGHKQYRGIVHTLSLTIKDEGMFAIYKGITPTLLGAMPYEGIKFGTVGVLETLYPASAGDDLPLRKMCFGGMGGVMAGLLTYPNDTVRRMLQIQGSRGTDSKFTGYWCVLAFEQNEYLYVYLCCLYSFSHTLFSRRDCVKQLYTQGGIPRFYRGIAVNLIRMAPNTAIQFYSYELLKQLSSDYTI